MKRGLGSFSTEFYSCLEYHRRSNDLYLIWSSGLYGKTSLFFIVSNVRVHTALERNISSSFLIWRHVTFPFMTLHFWIFLFFFGIEMYTRSCTASKHITPKHFLPSAFLEVLCLGHNFRISTTQSVASIHSVQSRHRRKQHSCSGRQIESNWDWLPL